MTVEEVLTEMEKMGSESTRKTYIKHGAKPPVFGVKVQDMKLIKKKTRNDLKLSLELYDTGVFDAMYLAGLISKPKEMTKAQIQSWAERAIFYWLSEYIVPWVASESNYSFELAREWIESDNPTIVSSGWSPWSSMLMIKPNTEFDLKELTNLMESIPAKIQQAPDRVRYTMNGFIITAGSSVPELFDKAKEIGKKLGKVTVDMNGTACKVPSIDEYLDKVKSMNRIGHKKKTAFC